MSEKQTMPGRLGPTATLDTPMTLSNGNMNEYPKQPVEDVGNPASERFKTETQPHPDATDPEFEYPPFHEVIVVMIALLLAMFLTALASLDPTAYSLPLR